VVQRSDCPDQSDRRFSLLPVAGFTDAFLLVARHSGKCLDVRAGGQDDGTPVVQWGCGDTATAGNQVWRIELPHGARRLVSAPPSEPAGATAPPPSGPAGAGASGGAGGAARGSAPATAGPPGAAEWTVGNAGTNPEWGRQAPPPGAPLSRAYQVILGDDPHGYLPRAGECAREVHARFWTWGTDGRVYPTWHPPRDPSGCAFGHEHGADPRAAALFAQVGWAPFGYANEQLAPSDPGRRRDEDHVGHKIASGNDLAVHANADPASPVVATCDALMMMHQGLHSPDEFTSNLHQLSYHVRCRYADDGTSIATSFTALLPIGHAGGFAVNEQCVGDGGRRHDRVGPAIPADSPSGQGERFIADAICASEIASGNGEISRINELWTYGASARNLGPLKRFEIITFMLSSNPARYFDADSPDSMAHTVDLCYRGAKGFACDQVRRLVDQAGGERIAFDDPRSPFNGAARLMSPNHLVVQNEGSPIVYTDVFATRFTTTPFPGAIRQYIAGDHVFDQNQGVINLPFRNYAADPDDRIHAPN
jgi:hypothetical protein